MSSAWYEFLLKKFVTEEEDEDGIRIQKEIRIQRIAPEMDPSRIGNLIKVKGLTGDQMSLLMNMMFDILPTQACLHRMKMTESPACDLCETIGSWVSL